MYLVFNDPTSGDAGQAKLAVHVRGDPSRFVEPIRRAIEDVDRTLPIAVDPVNDLVRGTVSEDALLVQVTMFFCIVTLVLAALGLYGVTAYSTSQRTSEFGLRAALGAEPGDVTRMVLGEAVRVAMIGVVIGVPAGLAATRLIRAQLFGVGTIDLPSLSRRDRRAGGDRRRRELFAGETSGEGRAVGSAAFRVGAARSRRTRNLRYTGRRVLDYRDSSHWRSGAASNFERKRNEAKAAAADE